MPQQNPEDTKQTNESNKVAQETADDLLRDKRTKMLETTNSAITLLQNELKAVKKLRSRRDALVSHLAGFYQEIDKLTKGKTLLPVTPLMVEQANDIIRDAKEVVTGDTYLDRIKEFIPAGDNPLFPDVLVVMRGVRDSLKRGEGQLESRRSHFDELLAEAKTISVALRLNLTSGEEIVTKEDVEEELAEEDIAEAWFVADDEGFENFDFEDLDTRNLGDYLARSPEDSFQDDEDSEQREEESSEQDEEQ